MKFHQKRERCFIEFQINDMLDALLAEHPTIERNDIIVNNIYKSIDRFKDVRIFFRLFKGWYDKFNKNS